MSAASLVDFGGAYQKYAPPDCDWCLGEGEREMNIDGADVPVFCGCDTGQAGEYKQMGWRYYKPVTRRTVDLYGTERR